MIASFLVTASLVLQALAAPADSTGPIVETGYTRFLGAPSSEVGVQFFGGIRYAQPPLGDLRWRAPQPLNESPPRPGVAKNVTDASRYGNICLQQPGTLDWNGQSDDCLFLNVFKPTSAKRGSKLPVVVYIHGGGNYGASARGFPLDKWVRVANGSVVGVNIQYRLGLLGSRFDLPFGFSYLPGLQVSCRLIWLLKTVLQTPDFMTNVLRSSGSIATLPLSVGIPTISLWQERVQEEVTLSTTLRLMVVGGNHCSKARYETTLLPTCCVAKSQQIAQSIGTDPVFTPTVYEVRVSFCFLPGSLTVTNDRAASPTFSTVPAVTLH